MKRLITFICLIVIIFAGYTLITKGFENKAFNIASYEVIEEKSEALTKKLASYDKKNQEEYETAVTNLNSSIRTFNDSKAKYEAIFEELADVLNNGSEEENELLEEIIYSDKEKYMMDFLLVHLGDYGDKEGVDVDFKLTTSSTTDPNSSTLNYFLADLKFTVTGQYINVANFISDLENDDQLGWEIKDFSMANGTNNGYTGVAATFTVKDVPIDSESYIATTSYVDSNTNANTNTENQPADGTATNPDATATQNPAADQNTVSNSTTTTGTVTDGNTVSNTVSNTTSNTVSNTVY